MSKRNKKNRQMVGEIKAEEPQDEMVQCPTCDAIVKAGLPGCPECGQEFLTGEEAEQIDDDIPDLGAAQDQEPVHVAEEPLDEEIPAPEEPAAPEEEALTVEADAPEEIQMPAEAEMAGEISAEDSAEAVGKEASEPPVIKKTMLVVGVMFSAFGSFGIVGLRAGLIQTILGYTVSPGIGPQEQLGLMVSAIPLILGLVIVLMWGIKNNPVYYDIQKAKGTVFGPLEPEEDEEADEDEALDALEQDLDFIAGMAVEPTEPEMPVKEPIEAPAAMKPEPPLQEPLVDVAPEPPYELLEDLDRELGSLDDVVPSLPEDGPMITTPDLKNLLAEEIRIEKCEKMLSAVVVLPDDKERLKDLISDGVSPSDLTEGIRKAVERRRRKEQERNVTAEEKASILEDELMVELSDLEGNLDKNDDEDLEDEILKEIEDLEGL